MKCSICGAVMYAGNICPTCSTTGIGPPAVPIRFSAVPTETKAGLPTDLHDGTPADTLRQALETIAGFPSQIFDAETPWKMREIAEKALEGGAQ